MIEVERDLLYVAAFGALLLLSRQGSAIALIAGVTGGIVAVVVTSFVYYTIAAPAVDDTQGYALFQPVGYANALGGMIAIGLPLVLAFAADARWALRRASVAAAVTFSVALYLTQNRSGALALGVALFVWLLGTSARADAVAAILFVALPAGVALAIVQRLDLLDRNSSVAQRESRALFAAATVAAIAAAAAAVTRLWSRPRFGRVALSHATRLAVLPLVAGFVFAASHLGDRSRYWSVAIEGTRNHWLFGNGAGTFDEQWFRYRDIGRGVRDAHSLYLETFNELGIVGLLVIAGLLLFPIGVAWSSRDPMFAAARGAYCAFLVHAAFEWDWEMPVVTLSALVLAMALLISGSSGPTIQLGRLGRLAAVVACASLTTFAVDALAGHEYLVAAERRVQAGDIVAAEERARRASRLIPWASEPWLVLGDSRARAGDVDGSRAALRQAVSRDPADWMLWYQLARVSQGEDRAYALRRAVSLNPLLFRPR
jgi:O-antigen ligase